MQTLGPIQGFYGVGGVTKFTFNGVGKAWFVDSVDGDDHDFGKTFAHALETIGEANDRAAAGDTIYLSGSFSEAVTCTKAGVKFVGIGTGPKQAIWTAPTVAASFCLCPTGDYVSVENIYFKPVVYVTSGIPSAIRLSGSNWFTAKGCQFRGQTGSYAAIYSPVCDSDNVHIQRCQFYYMNTATYGAGILGVEAGGLSYSGWLIEDCDFMGCVTDIDINGRACVLRRNVHPIGGIAADASVGAVTALAIDLSGTSSGGNVVTGCKLGGAYTSTLYKGGASQDCWAGNYAAITSTYCPNGVTVPAKPA